MLLPRTLGETLKMIMDERVWTQTRLAHELGEVSQRWVSDIVLGNRDCPLNKVARLLDRVGWDVHITPKSDKGGMEDDPVKRREFIAGTASTLLISSSKTTPFHDPSYVNGLTQRSIQALYQMGGNSLVATLLGQARKISSASVGGGPRLQSAASEFMRQGSWILRQAGRSDIAIRFANNARRLAGQAGDPDNLALAYSALGYVSIDPELDPRFLGAHATNGAGRAVEYAQRGLDVPGIGDEPRAFLTGLLACGLANVQGRERQARTKVDQALNIDTLSAIDRADIVGIAGNALRNTGERHEALKMLEDAVNLSISHSPHLQAMYLGDQIMIVLDMRDTARAASLMNTLSCLVPLVDSMMLDRQVQGILQSTKRWSAVPEIREARERLHAVRLTDEEPE